VNLVFSIIKLIIFQEKKPDLICRKRKKAETRASARVQKDLRFEI